MVTLADYFMGRDKKYASELTQQMRDDAQRTVDLANAVLQEFGESRSVNSGWRPAAINAGVPGAAKKSKHMLCQAIDLNDDDGDLDQWCLANIDILERIGVWLEHPNSTPRWCHLQILPPASGRRVFHP